MPLFNANIDLSQNQLLSAVVHSASAQPTSPSPVAGQIFYDTSVNQLQIYTGSAWEGVQTESAEGALQFNAALKIGRDADNLLDFTTDNQITFRVGAANGVVFKASGEIEATSLDISGDVDVDGTLETDALTIGGATIAAIGTTAITTLGTITTGTWQSGTARIHSDYLSTDTAHLTTTQTFTGAKTFNALASFTMDGNTITGVDDSGEFTDDDAHIMTSAGINDRFAQINANTTGTAALATAVTITANNTEDANMFPVFVDGATGTQGLETDNGYTYNPHSGVLTCTGMTAAGFVGDLTGDATGNAGTADKISSITNSNIVQLGESQTLTNKTIAISQVTELSNLTAAEGAQLEAIGSTTISANQWGYLGALTTDVQTELDKLQTLTTGEVDQLENIGATTIQPAQWAYLGAATGAITNTDTNDDVSVANLKTALAGGFGSNAVTIGDSGDVVTIGNDLVVTGDLTVSGDTTTVNTATLSVEDPLIKLASNNTGDAVDTGFYNKYVESSTVKFAGVFRDVSVSGDPFTFFDSLQAEPGTTVNTSGTGYDLADISAGKISSADGFSGELTGSLVGNASGSAGTVTSIGNLTGHITSTNRGTVLGSFTVAQLSAALSNANISGNNTGDQINIQGSSTSCTGLAATATALATPRAINGVDFNGTAAITVTAAASTLSGNTLKSTVLASSLTSVGLIANGQWRGTAVESAYLDADTAHLTTTQTFTGAKTFTNTVALTGTGRITGIDTVSAATDAASKAYVDANTAGDREVVLVLNNSVTGVASTDNVTYAVTHSLSSRNVMVEVIRNGANSGDYRTVYVDVTRTSDDIVTIVFGSARTAGDYTVMIQKIG